MKTKTTEEKARGAAGLDEESFKASRDSFIKWTEAEIKRCIENLKLYLAFLLQELNRLLQELSVRGDASEGVTIENVGRSLFLALLLLGSVGGEANLMFWALQELEVGVGAGVKLIVLAVLVCSFESMNQYLTSLRKKYPNVEDNLFLILGCVSFVLFLLIILCGTDVREALFRMDMIKNLGASPEEIANHAKTSYREISTTFKVMMASIGIAILLVGGISWHDLRNRLFSSLALRRLHKKINKVRREILHIEQQIKDLEAQLVKELAEFDMAVLNERNRLAARAAKSTGQRNAPQQVKASFVKGLVFPLCLIIIAIIIYVLLTGQARGETLICLDLSQSMAVNDYSGKQTEFMRNRQGIEGYIRYNAFPGESIKIIAITDRTFASLYLLAEGRITTKKGVFSQGVATDKLNLLKQLESHDLKPMAPQTDIFGAMQFAEIFFKESGGHNRLIIYSDMRQYGQGFNFEAPNVLDPNALLKEVMQKGLVASLDGATVWCLGVHGAGKTQAPSYWKSLREFWRLYFKQARVKELKAFTPERRFTNE